MGLIFNKEGNLKYYHDCVVCAIYPQTKNINEKCPMCGYSIKEIEEIKSKCEK